MPSGWVPVCFTQTVHPAENLPYPVRGGIGGKSKFRRTGQTLFEVVSIVKGHQFAMGNNQDLVTDGLHFREDMRAENNRVFLSQLTDQIPDLNDLDRVQSHSGFVENDHLRVAQQCLGNAHPLPVAFGQSGDPGGDAPIRSSPVP